MLFNPLIIAVLCVLLVSPATALRSLPKTKMALRLHNKNHQKKFSRLVLQDKNENSPQEKPQRKIAKYDNLGDPIYEDEIQSQGGSGINILGLQVDADPLTVSLLVFAVIAVQFFGVLFFQ